MRRWNGNHWTRRVRRLNVPGVLEQIKNIREKGGQKIVFTVGLPSVPQNLGHKPTW